MTDQNPYDDQVPMVYQSTDSSYQEDPQEAWPDEAHQQSYQQPVGNPSQQPMGAPYPPPRRPAYPPGPLMVQVTYPSEYDSDSAGWAVLGILLPIVGFILFLAWERRKPECAKVAGIGALIGVLVPVIIAIASMIYVVMFGVTSFSL